MMYLGLIVIVGFIAYLTQDKQDKKLPRWLKLIFWVLVLSILSKVSDTLAGAVFIGLIAWWFVKKPSRRRKQQVAEERSDTADAVPHFKSEEDPVKRYASTPKRQAALAELLSTPKELATYIDQEIDTFFMNEWTKMAAIYSDQTGQFDDDVRDNAGHQMREILDAIFAKFAKKKRAELVEKQSINEELKVKHKAEIDIAMQVYDKWQDKA